MKKSVKRILVLGLALALTVLAAAASAETLQIGIPDDGTNLSRGIKLLETAGLITVNPDAGYTPELADITGYSYDTMRRAWTMHPIEWSQDLREAVMQALGLRCRLVVEDIAPRK